MCFKLLYLTQTGRVRLNTRLMEPSNQLGVANFMVRKTKKYSLLLRLAITILALPSTTCFFYNVKKKWLKKLNGLFSHLMYC